jgi:hypothetical protein
MSLPHLNILLVRLDREKLGVFSSEDGHIIYLGASPPCAENPRGSRHWSWTTKGESKRSGKAGEYGMAIPLKIPLEYYFGDRPYLKGTIWAWDENLGYWVWRDPSVDSTSADLQLMPLSMGEDPNDSGEYVDGYTDPNLGILLGNVPNGMQDGDKRLRSYQEWTNYGQLNPFDIDNNGYVELPRATDPDDPGNYARQHDDNGEPYSKARVLRHTITHEVIHVLAGGSHSTDSRCVMYNRTNNWKRDDFLCDSYRSLLWIHNKLR